MNIIHIAGTKGKGTTVLYCEKLLSEYQKRERKYMKLGCLTSPHLSDVRERIRLDSKPISTDLFALHFSKLWEEMHEHALAPGSHSDLDIPPIPGYPGFLSLLGMYIFAKEGVEMAIIETGVGGEYDSTNFIDHATVTGITSLGLDHVHVLGDHIESIAWHKAGIFKKDAHAFTVQQNTSALEVLRERSLEKKVAGHLRIVPEDLVHTYGVTVVPDQPYQKRNASLAIAICESYLKSIDPDFSMAPAIARTLGQTQLPGRNEIYKDEQRTWLLDAAHNAMSMEEASVWFEKSLQSDE